MLGSGLEHAYSVVKIAVQVPFMAVSARYFTLTLAAQTAVLINNSKGAVMRSGTYIDIFTLA